MNKVVTKTAQHKWLILIMILAAVLRVYNLDFQSMWLDELFTMAVTNPDLTWSQFHKEIVTRESFPFLYFIIVKGFYFLFGYSSLVARMVSVLAGIFGVYAAYLLGKKIHTKQVGLIASLFVAVSNYHIYISQDARAYSLYFLFVCLSFYTLLIYIKRPTWKYVLLYALTTGFLVNFNFFAPINVVSQGLILLCLLFLLPKNKRIAFIQKGAVAAFIIFGAFIVNYQKLKVLLNYKKFWTPAPQDDSLAKIFKNFFGNSEILLALITPFIVYYLFLILKNKEPRKWTYNKVIKNKLFFGFLVLFTWFFVLFSYLAVKSYGPISYLLTRYFVSVLPVIFICVAIAIASIKGTVGKGIAVFVMVFFMMAHLFVVKKQYTTITHAQYRDAATFVKTNNTQNAPTYSNQEYWYKFYFRPDQTKIKLKDLSLNNIYLQLKKYPSKMTSFWYIDAFKRFDSVNKPTSEFLNKHFVIKKQYKGYRAWATYYELKKQSR